MVIFRPPSQPNTIVHPQKKHEKENNEIKKKDQIAGDNPRTLISKLLSRPCHCLGTLGVDDALSNAVIKARTLREYHDNQPNDG